jgi:alpha-glucosidase
MLLWRQRLIPYLYTLFEEAHRSGAPILRPLLFEFPDDETTYATDDEFLVGSALLVAPIARPGVEYRHVYLPRGTWVHYWSGERFKGPAHVLARAPLGQPAVYVRANTPMPLWPEMAFESERAVDPLTWLVFVASAEDGDGYLYEDAGEGYAFEQGGFARTHLTCRAANDVELVFDPVQGSFVSPSATIELELRGVAQPMQVTVDGAVSNDWEHSNRRLVLRLERSREARRVHVRAAVA